MKIVLVVIASLLLMFSNSATFADDGNDAALSMVNALGLGNNLAPMAFRAATNTQTYRNIVYLVGEEKAKTLLQEESSRSVAIHQEEWNKNLAASYSEFFSPDELRSIAVEKQKSPYASKLIANQSEVGRSMQSKSQSLLVQIVAETIGPAFKRASSSGEVQPTAPVDR